jgi:hypothetical protein
LRMPAADGDRAMGARSADGARMGKLDWCRGAAIENQAMTKRIDGVSRDDAALAPLLAPLQVAGH